MDTHKNARLTPKNARLTPKGREGMVRAVMDGKAAAARRFNPTPKTVAKWVKRFRAEGVDGLHDRASRPLSLPSQTAPATCAGVAALRRQRHTGKQIAAACPRQLSAAFCGGRAATGSRRWSRRRYERDHPGELIHIDIKKLGKFNRIGHRITGDRTGQSNARGIGWEFVHVRPRLRRRRLPDRFQPGEEGREESQRRRLSKWLSPPMQAWACGSRAS